MSCRRIWPVFSKRTLPHFAACRRILPAPWSPTFWKGSDGKVSRTVAGRSSLVVSKTPPCLVRGLTVRTNDEWRTTNDRRPTTAMRAFAQAERFVSELESRKLRAAYIFVGDEAFFRKRFRDAILDHLVPTDLRDFSIFEFDLAENDLAEVLDRARTPSLMAPFQVFFVRGVKTLFGRGSNDEKLAAIEAYCKDPNPDAVLIFVADHISIPADARRMDMTDKERYERIRETLGGFCAIVELARVEESEAVRWIGEYCATQGVKMDADAARELVDALGG